MDVRLRLPGELRHRADRPAGRRLRVRHHRPGQRRPRDGRAGRRDDPHPAPLRPTSSTRSTCPQFLYKKDVIPGRVNEFEVIVEQPGTYGGQCAEFCGLVPRRHVLHGARPRTAPTSTPGSRPQLEAANASPPPAPSALGRPAARGATVQVSASSATGFDQTDADGAGRHADHHRVHQRRPERRRTTVSIKGGQPDGTDFIGLPLADAGQTVDLPVAPPLAAGTYTFYCSVHPNMTGTLTVQ